MIFVWHLYIHFLKYSLSLHYMGMSICLSACLSGICLPVSTSICPQVHPLSVRSCITVNASVCMAQKPMDVCSGYCCRTVSSCRHCYNGFFYFTFFLCSVSLCLKLLLLPPLHLWQLCVQVLCLSLWLLPCPPFWWDYQQHWVSMLWFFHHCWHWKTQEVLLAFVTVPQQQPQSQMTPQVYTNYAMVSTGKFLFQR